MPENYMKKEPEKNLISNSIFMKNILKEKFLSSSRWYTENQVEDVKKSIETDFEKVYNWELEYFDYFWEPLVSSYKDWNYYLINKNWELENWMLYYSENDLERLSFEEFNKRFNNIWEKLKKEFYQKAKIENELELILSVENLEKYFNELLNSSNFSNEEKKQILKAKDLAKEKHKWQLRDEWIEYYSHPLFVAIKWLELWLNSDDIISLLLHDTIEDTDLSYQDINNIFWKEIAENVLWLSKKANWEEIIWKEEYYINISKNKKLAILKWLDRLANLYSLNFASKEKQGKYLKETKQIILPIVEKYNLELSQKINNLIKYLENDIYKLPLQIKSRLEDLKKIKEIKEDINN